MNFEGFLGQNCFFNESVCFFAFKHFVRRCRAVFSYEFIKGSLVEKLPSYGDLKMQRVQYSNSSSSSAVKVTIQ